MRKNTMQKTNKTTEYVFAENCAGAVRSFMATVLLFYGMVFLATSILEEWTISKASFVWIQVFLFLAIVLFHVAPLCGKYEAVWSSAWRRTLITTDGTTLLGADDKAGIAEILTAIEEIIAEHIPHGDLWIGFTPDEEIGCGADLFDLNIFQADYAYTVDGDYEGEVAYENFNAASATFHIKGVNVHPGEAKDIMINAALVGYEIVSLLPANETPAHTSGREGFYHLTDMSGDVASATLSFIIRDHDKTQFENRLQKLRDITMSLNQKYGTDTITLEIEHSYENMLSVIENQMEIVNLAKQAISVEGLTPLSRPIRGGTDGARLSFMGLPCPNLGTGGYGFHGPYEHISVEAMQTAVRILKYIASHPIEKA